MKAANLAAAGRDAGFTLLGEPLAVDLANTLKTAVSPARELLPDGRANERFWQLESSALPEGAGVPDLGETLRLRSAVRGVLASLRIAGEVDAADLTLLNETAALATVEPRLVSTPSGLEVREVWTAARPESLALAAAARSALDLVGGPLRARLRECASPTCSLLFVATNAKRIWCAPDVCGNRQRVARHARAVAAATRRRDRQPAP